MCVNIAFSTFDIRRCILIVTWYAGELTAHILWFVGKWSVLYGSPLWSCCRFIFHSMDARQPYPRSHVEFYVRTWTSTSERIYGWRTHVEWKLNLQSVPIACNTDTLFSGASSLEPTTFAPDWPTPSPTTHQKLTHPAARFLCDSWATCSLWPTFKATCNTLFST